MRKMNIKEEIMRGIDISHWQDISASQWDYIASHFDFVMLKYGGEEKTVGKINHDQKFKEYYSAAKARCMYVGCYFFITNDSVALLGDASKIANMLADELAGYSFEMPVALDVENDRSAGLNKVSKQQLTNYVKIWCDTMESRGYYVTIYGSDYSTFYEHLNMGDLALYDKWVARYGNAPSKVDIFGMWQYTSELPLFDMRVDGDIAYKNYPQIISYHKLNNVVIEQEETSGNSDEVVNYDMVIGCLEVIVDNITTLKNIIEEGREENENK